MASSGYSAGRGSSCGFPPIGRGRPTSPIGRGRTTSRKVCVQIRGVRIFGRGEFGLVVRNAGFVNFRLKTSIKRDIFLAHAGRGA